MATNSYGWAAPQVNTLRSVNRQDGLAPDIYAQASPTNMAPQSNSQSFRSDYNPQYAYGIPGTDMQRSNVPNTQSSILDQWRGKYGPSSQVDYSNEGHRNMAEGFANYYAIPYGNLELANRTADFNEYSTMEDFNERRRMNNLGYSLDRAAAQREDEALRFGQYTNTRDFGEDTRRWDSSFGLQEELGRGELSLGNRRAGIDERLGLGRLDVDRYGIDSQQALGMAGIDRDLTINKANVATETRGQDITRALGMAGIDAERYATDKTYRAAADRVALDRELGTGQLSNDRYANETGRMGVENQFTLGQGQLGFQNRELNVNDAYRQRALAQEAELTRERFRNENQNARYSAFGRAQAPNMRAAQSWY